MNDVQESTDNITQGPVLPWLDVQLEEINAKISSTIAQLSAMEQIDKSTMSIERRYIHELRISELQGNQIFWMKQRDIFMRHFGDAQ